MRDDAQKITAINNSAAAIGQFHPCERGRVAASCAITGGAEDRAVGSFLETCVEDVCFAACVCFVMGVCFVVGMDLIACICRENPRCGAATSLSNALLVLRSIL